MHTGTARIENRRIREKVEILRMEAPLESQMTEM